MTPIIGLTLDWREAGHYSKFPRYALRENYANAIADAGGLPILLPFHVDQINAYLDRVHGLVITGGDFDVDPKLYGEDCKHERVIPIPNRTKFEYALVREALDRDMPILGICGGHQLMNVVLGGSLIQHIPDEIEDCLAHEQLNPKDEASHSVKITPDSLLHRIVGDLSMDVNSAHHQAVKRPGNGVIISAVAADGVIEGIEHPGYTFCVGLQWHPEFIISSSDQKVFDAFIQACK